jgi:ABC-type Zn uptake system ZnuABC Zn-binding protein ZnuA
VAAVSVWAGAKVKVVTSTSDLAEFVRVVGGNRVEVDFIVRGTQNPHFVEVKPSYMMKLKSAQIFIMVGMQMEPWASQIIDGSRNANLMIIDCSRDIVKMEVPPGKVDASQGDVHPFGNPHYWLDPENVRVILNEIVDALAKVSPGDREYFRANADAYTKDLASSLKEWKKALEPFRGRTLITYHTSFSYFANRFGLEIAGYVEPKPGIPPSPSHVTELIQRMKSHSIRVIGVEQFYEQSIPSSLARTTGAALVRLATAVGGLDGTNTYKNLIEYNVRTLATAFRENP